MVSSRPRLPPHYPGTENSCRERGRGRGGEGERGERGERGRGGERVKQ